MSLAESGDEAGNEIRQSHIAVRRSARYAVLGEASPSIERLWFVCHGYRQLAGRFLRRFRVLDDGRTLIVAPEALNRFYLDDAPGPHGPESRVGGTWMTREDRHAEIGDYVYYLEALYNHIVAELGLEPPATRAGGRHADADDSPTPRVHVLGFSQGAATVSRWAAYGSVRIDRLTLWAGLPAHDLELGAAAERLREMDLTLVLGEADEYTRMERAERTQAELLERGIDSTLMTFPGGHWIDPDTLDALNRSG